MVKIEPKYGIYIKEQQLDTRLDLSAAEPSLFVKVLNCPFQFLRFTPNNDVYRLESIIKTNREIASTQFPKTINLTAARDNFENYLTEEDFRDSIIYYEVKVQSIVEINNEIKQLEKIMF